MLPLKFNLTGGGDYRCYRSDWSDFVPVERVSSGCGFGMNHVKIPVDSQAGSSVQLKSFKLRVVPIADGFVAQHGTSQE